MFDLFMYLVLVLMALLILVGMAVSMLGAYQRAKEEAEYLEMRRRACMDDAHDSSPPRTRWPSGWWVQGTHSKRRIMGYHRPVMYQGRYISK
jgi:hypothetical protein